VVVIDGAGVYETSNAGVSWSPLLAYTGDLYDAAWDPAGGFVYLATADDAVVTNDPGVSDIGLPVHRVHTIAYDAPTRSLLAGTSNGLYVTRLLDPADVGNDAESTPRMLSVRVAPVPARGSVTIELRRAVFSSSTPGASTQDAAARIDVVDVHGRIVKRLYEGTVPPEMRIDWDTLDEGTRPVPAGLYWVRATVAGYSRSTERVLILR
jgi:hypothetical protein